MTGKVDYGQLEKEIKEQESRRNSGEGAKWLRLKYGDSKFMVCPPKDANSPWFQEIHIHYGFQDSQGRNRAYQCSTPKHGKCPICDQSDKLKAEGNSRGDDISVSKAFLFNVLHVENEEGKFQNYDLKLLSAKASQKNEIVSEYMSYNKDEDVDAADLNNRRIFRGTRSKTDPWFSGRLLSKKADITDDFIKDVETKLHDLSTVYVDNTPEELTRLLNGEDINKRDDTTGEVKKEATTTDKTTEEVKAQDAHVASIAKETTTTPTTEKKKLSVDELMEKLK